MCGNGQMPDALVPFDIILETIYFVGNKLITETQTLKYIHKTSLNKLSELENAYGVCIKLYRKNTC